MNLQKCVRCKQRPAMVFITRLDAPGQPGTNTVQAMTLGIDRGAVGMVREMLDVVQSGKTHTAVVSGGDAPFFMQGISGLIDGGKFFTLRGIYLIARQSAEKR